MNEQVKSIDVEEVNVLSAVSKKKKHTSIGKRIAAGLGVAAIACSMALGVSATDGETSTATTADLQTAMTTSFSTVKDDIINTAAAVLPYGLGIFAITFCIRKGKRIFTSVSR